ncbi:MAG: TetR/AcrR family transcriptional regulator [Burkholderiaceae bacterium]
MHASRIKPATPQKLPRGRHPLTQAAVTGSQRVRLLDAVARVVAEKGYGAATVADVIALAGVSRRTFYEHFPGLDDCFLAAYEDGMRSLFAAIRSALAGVPRDDLALRTRVAIDAYLAAMASVPAAAWSFTVEVLGAGRRALDRRDWVMAQWVEQWRAFHQRRQQLEPGLGDVSDGQLLALVGGMEELVRDQLRRHGAQSLPRIGVALRDFAVSALVAPPVPG